MALRQQGVPDANGFNPVVQQWASDGVPIDTIIRAVNIARHERGKHNPGVKYLSPIVADLLAAPTGSSTPSQTTKAMQALQAMKAGIPE